MKEKKMKERREADEERVDTRTAHTVAKQSTLMHFNSFAFALAAAT